jgi:hypothetical protein
MSTPYQGWVRLSDDGRSEGTGPSQSYGAHFGCMEVDVTPDGPPPYPTPRAGGGSLLPSVSMADEIS